MLFNPLSLATVFAVGVYASCMHGLDTLEKRQEASVPVNTFSYTGGRNGPLVWAGLAPENRPCARGRNQSPINIDSSISFAAAAPATNFPFVARSQLQNLGTTLQVPVNGTLTLAGRRFDLRQFHFHTPSEHRIALEYYPLEMHMVHQAADGSGAIAVLTFLFQLSQSSTTPLLTEVFRNIAQAATPGSSAPTGPLDFSQLTNAARNSRLYQYSGSLTTPPCAEVVTFLVSQAPLPINVETYNKVKGVIKFNSRYTQNALGQPNLLTLNGGLPAGQVSSHEGAVE